MSLFILLTLQILDNRLTIGVRKCAFFEVKPSKYFNINLYLGNNKNLGNKFVVLQISGVCLKQRCANHCEPFTLKCYFLYCLSSYRTYKNYFLSYLETKMINGHMCVTKMTYHLCKQQVICDQSNQNRIEVSLGPKNTN